MRLVNIILAVCLLLVASLIIASRTDSDKPKHDIFLVATTSTDNSGLLAFLIPQYEKRYPHDHIHVLATGSGQAIEIGKKGDADILLVHDPKTEQQFVQDGYALLHASIMRNDFVLVGPKHDPCATTDATNVKQAFDRLLQHCAIFVSRGDNSGTHTKEQELWQLTDFHHNATPQPIDYRQTGSGMGATLNIAATLDAYTLSDRATFASFMNKQQLQILYQGDDALMNIYSIILPKNHRFDNNHAAKRLAEWLQSLEGKNAINAFAISNQQMFFALP